MKITVMVVSFFIWTNWIVLVVLCSTLESVMCSVVRKMGLMLITLVS